MVRPEDNKWGSLVDSKNFSGTIGVLQTERADFSALLSYNVERMKAMDVSRIYSKEPLILVTLKPQPLPAFLSLVRPFEC